MSDFVLEYDVLASIIGYSKDLEKQTNDYAEELERNIVTAIDNVTGTSSGNLTSAKDLVSDKINMLKRKSDNFNYLAKQISDLLEVAEQMDQEVADTIAMQSKYNVVHNESGRLENWIDEMLKLLVGIGNNKLVMKLIADSLKYLLPGSKLTIDLIIEWYKEAFTEYRKSEWMSGYGKEVRKFPDLKNSSDNDNVDLKNAIKNWYKDPDYKQNNKTEDKDNRKLLPYEQDLKNLKYARNLPQAYRYLLKYLWDRFPGLYSEQMKQMAIIGGMDPEWAEIYGDFATMPLLEGFTVVTVKGVQAIKNLKTGEIIYSESVVAGSGVGNLTNKANAGSKAIGEGAGKLTTGADWSGKTNELAKTAPTSIPSNATIKVQSKTGYDQISYKWSDGTYKFEARWHTKTPGAPTGQGNTWVVERTTPGTPTGQKAVTHILTGDSVWTSRNDWQQAITAFQNDIATEAQKTLLERGHWVAP
ncbi:MAG: hypothetical protein K0R05_1204 [Anaerocolumna sp.]|jgi:hypothetical protein|nr:hypothetical protein [Anaerocolumna sp.]